MLEEAKLLDDDSDADGRRTWGTNIELDGVTYATSLFWQPLQNKDDPFTEVGEASEGVMEGADLFCIKQGKAPQFGICASKEGYKSGENVAAVTLATAMADRSSFVAVFKVDNGWWYTCIRNDIILSDGDMLFLNEQEAKDQFLSMLAVRRLSACGCFPASSTAFFWRRRNGRLSRRLPPKWSSPSRCRRKSSPGRSFPTPNRL